jgi:hypothetical protein
MAKNWKSFFKRKLRKHKKDFNFNQKKADDVIDFGEKAYRFDGKRWVASKDEDEQELEISDSYTNNDPDSFASSKALRDLSVNIDSRLENISSSKISYDSNSFVEAKNKYTIIRTNDGYLNLGPQNGSWCHISTDRPTFYFNKNVHVDGKIGIYGKDAEVIDGNGKIKASSIKNVPESWSIKMTLNGTTLNITTS